MVNIIEQQQAVIIATTNLDWAVAARNGQLKVSQ